MSRTIPPALTSARWNGRTKRIVGIVLAGLVAFGLITFASVLPLLIVATLLSYLLWPLVNQFEKRVLVIFPFKTRSFSVLATFLTVISSFVVALVVIVPVLVSQLAAIGQDIPGFLEDAETEIRRVLSQPVTFNGTPVLFDGEPLIPLERIESLTGEGGVDGLLGSENFDLMQALGTFLGSLGTLTGPAFNVLGGAITAIINIAFMIVIMFYLMRDGENFIGHIVNITPRSYQGDVRRLLHELGNVWNAYLRGQLILCLVVGVAVYLAALVLGLPSAPILGLIAGFLEFIPNLGPFMALIPAALLALISESSTLPFLSGLPFAIVVIVTWTGIQQLESIYLVPRVMGGSLDLHPVVVIIAVIAGASTAGALGVILAAPFTASARVVGQYFYGKLFDSEPFPTPKPYESLPSKPVIVRLYLSIRQVVVRRGSGHESVSIDETYSTLEMDVVPELSNIMKTDDSEVKSRE